MNVSSCYYAEHVTTKQRVLLDNVVYSHERAIYYQVMLKYECIASAFRMN